MENITAQLQLIRLNVMPPYTYDDDEGQRSDEDYIRFYNSHIEEAIKAADAYIEQFQEVTQRPESDEAFADYLAARRQFVATLPFCNDEFPGTEEADYNSTCNALRSYLCDERKGNSHARDLESLTKLQYFLRSYHTKLT